MQTKRGNPGAPRPVISDVMPAGSAPQLIRLPKRPLRKRLVIFIRRHTRAVATSGIIAGAVLIIVSVILLWPEHSTTLPLSVTSQVNGFSVYGFKGTPPNNFQIDPASAEYNSNVLFFRMTNPGGQAIIVSEQTLPSDISGIPQGNQKVSVQDGNATISTSGGRTVGLLSIPHTHTLVLLNTTDAIGTTTMTNLLQALRQQ